jgi:hypothetical protein
MLGRQSASSVLPELVGAVCLQCASSECRPEINSVLGDTEVSWSVCKPACEASWRDVRHAFQALAVTFADEWYWDSLSSACSRLLTSVGIFTSKVAKCLRMTNCTFKRSIQVTHGQITPLVPHSAKGRKWPGLYVAFSRARL